MAQTATMLISIFFNLLSLTFAPCIASMSNGFSLKLVHRDSPDSPLYQPNLSDFERFKKNIKISIARASYFQRRSEIIYTKNSKKIQNESLLFPLKYTEPLYTVELGLGTPVVKRTLIFDTGSSLTWTQCRPCLRCFKQKEPLFNVIRSSSYKLMSRRNKLAKSFRCNMFGCVYYVQYYSGQFSGGVVSVESFTFQTTAGVPRRVPDLVFGCGTSNKGPLSSENAVSGIFGMAKAEESFVRQVGGLIKKRFSYCLSEVYNSNTNSSYLRFGEEALIRGRNIQSTPFLKNMRNARFYGLDFIDISIGGFKLGLRGTFPEGGIIDSGSSISLLNSKAYSAVQNSLHRYFSRFKNVKRFAGKITPPGFLCYTQPTGFRNFPDMTFHFQGADFHVPPVNLFMFDERKFFCLAMIASTNLTILGAYQQQNVRIMYDLEDEMLSFAPEDCSKDAA